MTLNEGWAQLKSSGNFKYCEMSYSFIEMRHSIYPFHPLAVYALPLQ